MADMLKVLEKYKNSGDVANIYMKPEVEPPFHKCKVTRVSKKFVTINPVEISDSAVDVVAIRDIHHISDVDGNVEYVERKP